MHSVASFLFSSDEHFGQLNVTNFPIFKSILWLQRYYRNQNHIHTHTMAKFETKTKSKREKKKTSLASYFICFSARFVEVERQVLLLTSLFIFLFLANNEIRLWCAIDMNGKTLSKMANCSVARKTKPNIANRRHIAILEHILQRTMNRLKWGDFTIFFSLCCNKNSF